LGVLAAQISTKNRWIRRKAFFISYKCVYSLILVLKGDKKVNVYTCLFLTENFQGSGFIR